MEWRLVLAGLLLLGGFALKEYYPRHSGKITAGSGLSSSGVILWILVTL